MRGHDEAQKLHHMGCVYICVWCVVCSVCCDSGVNMWLCGR